MQAEVSPARPARARYRHELRSLTYVMLDQANGGIVRNLTRDGIAVQAVAAVRCGQQLRVRFDLPNPRLRLDTWGEVMWANPGGQCGIRFIDLPARTARRIDEWIFGSLLESVPLHSHHAASMFHSARLVTTPLVTDEAEDDGLIVSPAPVKVIELPTRPAPPEAVRIDEGEAASSATAELDWLSQPLSGRGIAWTVNALTVLAAVLLFALVFLSVTREAPKRPVALAAGAMIFVAAAYWGFFKLFGGVSLGTRLARLTGYDREEEGEAVSQRFR